MEARFVREDPDVPVWTVDQELAAQLIEEVSVYVAGRRRKKPREIPRPGAPRKNSADVDPQAFMSEDGAVQVRGHAQMRAYAAIKMGVNLG